MGSSADVSELPESPAGFSAAELAILAEIGNSKSLAYSYELYRAHLGELENCTIVFGSDTGSTPGYAVNRSFCAGTVVRTLFRSEKVFVLDREVVLDMQRGSATFALDYSISLDTSALSYLEPYLKNRSERLPKDFADVFAFIARDDVNVDPMPYLYENMENLYCQRKLDRIFEKLKAYEVLRTLDTGRLARHGEVCSRLSPAALDERTQRNLSRHLHESSDPAIMAALRLRHRFSYAMLLKMACIELAAPREELGRKLLRFLQFCDLDLATIGIRELVIAHSYFSRGQELRFFGRIQKGRNDLLENLRSMAWDILHVRHLEQALTFNLLEGARFFFSALLVTDKRLIEVIDLYPLRCCAYKKGGHTALPFFGGDMHQIFADDLATELQISESFFAPAACASRDLRRSEAKSKYADVVRALEAEIASVAGVQQQTIGPA